MSDLDNAKAVVAGAGAFGSAVALALARSGAAVTIIDPRPLADSASGIAAGMLAPAFEAALDPGSAHQFSLLRRARDLWPAFVEDLGPTGLERCGALLKAPPQELERVDDVMRRQGAICEIVGGSLFTPEDWRLEPRLCLAAIRREVLHVRGDTITGEVVKATINSVTLKGGQTLNADIVVLACGFGGRDLAPELAALSPIKGQLLRFPDAGLVDGPVLRSLLGYVVPSREGAVCGATMEEGKSDLSLSRDALDRLKVEAAWLSPGLGLAHSNGLAGIRAATSDGLPLLGRSRTGVWLAAGARRNGWLLAPAAAAILTRAIKGQAVADDTLYRADRFTPR